MKDKILKLLLEKTKYHYHYGEDKIERRISF